MDDTLYSYLYLIDSSSELSNWSMSLIRKLNGIPLLDSLPRGSSECFSDTARPLEDIPTYHTHQNDKHSRGFYIPEMVVSQPDQPTLAKAWPLSG